MKVSVVGGGLAGCEAALQLTQQGYMVRLMEMRPEKSTEAHHTDTLGELVCTNSFKSEDPANALGQLKRELRMLGAVLLHSADVARVPAGAALAVDRTLFTQAMTAAIEAESAIEIVREECTDLPHGPTIIATGPLTSDPLSEAIQQELGDGGLSFFDAIAPIVHRDGLDENVVFAAGRFDQDADYLNCPMSEPEYLAFVEALRGGVGHQGHDWDTVPYFEGCLPIEVMASRGKDTLRFGPMKPIGLTDPQTGKRPWAVVQLRREDRAGQMWNLVGFQTRLQIGEQREIFKTIPGLSNAEFLRWGSIHRNSYLNFPGCLSSSGSSKKRTDLIFAGQLTGVEGYTESAASGILAGINLGRSLSDQEPLIPPPTTVLGGLFRYLRDADPKHFQPMNSNWGLVDPLSQRIRSKRARRESLAQRANEDFLVWMQESGLALDRARASA